jgi:hypothetical protein
VESLIYHDINSSDFPNLREIHQSAISRVPDFKLFNQNSPSDERCHCEFINHLVPGNLLRPISNMIVLIIVLILLFAGGIGWNQGWYGGGGFGSILGLILIIILVCWLLGYRSF